MGGKNDEGYVSGYAGGSGSSSGNGGESGSGGGSNANVPAGPPPPLPTKPPRVYPFIESCRRIEEQERIRDN